MASIRDIAKSTGVSIATVSRVVNDRPGVGEDVRDRVLAEVERLGYRSNRLAINLHSKSSNLIALFQDNHKSRFAAMVHTAVEAILKPEGYQVLTCCTHSQADRERTYVRAMIDLQVAGAIVRPTTSTSETTKNIRRMHSHGIPTIYFEMLANTRRSDSYVVCDNQAGGRLGIEHLIENKHRHIGIIATRADQDPRRERAGNHRMRGILEAAAEHGVSDTLYIAQPSQLYRHDLGYVNATSLLSHHPEITALFALTDNSAIGAMHAVMDMGFSIPDDVSILGYDGLPLGEAVVPPLSTVVQPIEDMGAEAAKALLSAIKEENAPSQQLVLPVQLCPRQSVKQLSN